LDVRERPCCRGRMSVEGMQALARRVNTIAQSSGTGAGRGPFLMHCAGLLQSGAGVPTLRGAVGATAQHDEWLRAWALGRH